MESDWELLVSDIEHGKLNEKLQLPQYVRHMDDCKIEFFVVDRDVRDKVNKLLKPDKRRAQELRKEFTNGFLGKESDQVPLPFNSLSPLSHLSSFFLCCLLQHTYFIFCPYRNCTAHLATSSICSFMRHRFICSICWKTESEIFGSSIININNWVSYRLDCVLWEFERLYHSTSKKTCDGTHHCFYLSPGWHNPKSLFTPHCMLQLKDSLVWRWTYV